MVNNINYQIWFKVCRPMKRKYKLSTNCLLVLNGIYIYSSYVSKVFTRRKVFDFVRYYDNRRTGNYLTVLMCNGFINESGLQSNRYQLYSISEKGIHVINELNESYKIEFNKFCLLYGISL